MSETTKYSWSWAERRFWISAIWSHYKKAKNSNRLCHTYFWDCVRGTIALILNLENEKITEWDWPNHKEDIAWANHHHGFDGEYSTHDWDYLSISGFYFTIDHDGCP